MVSAVETYATTATGPWGTTSRRLLARQIVGSGLELGPGHVPFPGGPGVSVRIVDRWNPEENHELFPELEDADFVMPDIVADLNTDRLRAVPDASQDFVICSHVLEHLAEPMGLVADIHRVLRPGGVAMIYLPDRRRAFDRFRDGTPLAHLVAEYERAVTEVDDAHLIDYLNDVAVFDESSSSVTRGIPIADDPAERREQFENERRRSFHVHCWQAEEFLSVLLYGVEQLGWRWEFVEGSLAEDDGDMGIEFGFVLRVATVDVSSAVLAERLDLGWHVWREERLGRLGLLAFADHRAAIAEEAAENVQVRLDRIDGSAPMRLYHFARRVTRSF